VADVIAWGIAIGLAGVMLLIVEAHVSTGGILGGLGAVIAALGIGLFLTGSGSRLMLVIPISIAAAGSGAVFAIVAARKTIGALRAAVQTGPDRLVGSTAVVRSWSGWQGQVAAEGGLWTARLQHGWERESAPVEGERMIVEALNGLTLSVRPRQSWELELS
jgi:membrane-bound ClpP family serine protease